MQLSRRQAAALALTALCVAGGVALHLRSRSGDDLERVRRETRSGQALLVDVREPEETARGFLENARLVPLSKLTTQMAATLPSDRPLYLYCSKGGRARQAAHILGEKGLDARPLSTGFAGLVAAGFPTEAGGSAP